MLFLLDKDGWKTTHRFVNSEALKTDVQRSWQSCAEWLLNKTSLAFHFLFLCSPMYPSAALRNLQISEDRWHGTPFIALCRKDIRGCGVPCSWLSYCVTCTEFGVGGRDLEDGGHTASHRGGRRLNCSDSVQRRAVLHWTALQHACHYKSWTSKGRSLFFPCHPLGGPSAREWPTCIILCMF